MSNVEQFHERLEKLTEEQVDEETSAVIAEQYPKPVVVNPSAVTKFMAEDLRIFTKLLLTEDVEKVFRHAAEGKPSRFTVVIDGGKPNTTVIDQHIRDPALLFQSAGVSEGRLSVKLLHVEGEC